MSFLSFITCRLGVLWNNLITFNLIIVVSVVGQLIDMIKYLTFKHCNIDFDISTQQQCMVKTHNTCTMWWNMLKNVRS